MNPRRTGGIVLPFEITDLPSFDREFRIDAGTIRRPRPARRRRGTRAKAKEMVLVA